ncbi:DUF421 domain-containing protein [Paenibacillus sp. JSM ZJ436]|uniref:DUF421 domain-containing protein n=1 Tax=Paenibacillus sp. JSM ZJ436 TaxID=3376190 RepID=UPI00378CA457
MPMWLEVSVRTLSSLVILFLLTKLLGKRQASQLSFFEYITGITIGSLAAYISLDLEGNWYLGIVALVVWVILSLGIEMLQIKSKRIRDFIDFKARVLVRNGKIQEAALKKEKMSSDELMEQLRNKSVFDLADVEFAIMESSGEVNVMLAPDKQPLTPGDLNLRTQKLKEPQIVIMDGQLMKEPLQAAGRSEQWLQSQLEPAQLKYKDVYLGQVGSDGCLHLDLYNDARPLPAPSRSRTLYAALKQCEADLELMSLTAESEHEKNQFHDLTGRLNQLLTEARPLLKSRKQG